MVQEQVNQLLLAPAQHPRSSKIDS